MISANLVIPAQNYDELSYGQDKGRIEGRTDGRMEKRTATGNKNTSST